MNRLWAGSLCAFVLSMAALAGGIGAAWLGHREVANSVWMAGTLPALAFLLHSLVNMLARRDTAIDVLALVSIGAAVTLGQNLTGCVIAVMFVSGQALESFAQRRAGKEMTSLLERAPRTAHRFDGEELVQVALDAVRPGDRLLVRSGDVVPVDGTLTSARAVLDESALTGESTPVERRAGDALRNGTLNAGAAFELLAAATSADSTFAGIVKLVSAAQGSKAPASRLADRYALWFVPASLALAAVAWFGSGDPIRALAVLVVATPCPLILAVPVAIVSGMSSGARRGILIKGGAALEKLAQAKVLFFDKTGTLTGGRARLIAIDGDGDIAPDEVLRIAASLDQMSNHVIASAVVAAARERGLALSIPGDVREQGGAGMAGVVDGRQVVIGAYDHVCAVAAPAPWAQHVLERVGDAGGAAVFVALEDRMVGALHLADQIRLETPRALRLLRRAGVERMVMLTGDRQDVAEAIGAAVGVDEVRAGLSPAGKLAAIESERHGRGTMMVGDGVNDAPALAVADVGVAMGARGAAASSEAADIVLLVDRLDRLAEAVHVAQQARSIAVQSVLTGMGLSIVAMLFAALGYLPPLAGAVLQEVIDVAVILNALRALRIAPLRSSRRRLTAAESGRLRAEHEALAPVLDRLRLVADGMTVLPWPRTAQALAELDDLLRRSLLPHERTDETTVYPAMAHLLGGDDPMAAMSRTHREIFSLGRRVGHIVKHLPSTVTPDSRSLRELQRLLYSLDAIVRLHFVQEEEMYDAVS